MFEEQKKPDRSFRSGLNLIVLSLIDNLTINQRQISRAIDLLTGKRIVDAFGKIISFIKRSLRGQVEDHDIGWLARFQMPSFMQTKNVSWIGAHPVQQLFQGADAALDEFGIHHRKSRLTASNTVSCPPHVIFWLFSL